MLCKVRRVVAGDGGQVGVVLDELLLELAYALALGELVEGDAVAECESGGGAEATTLKKKKAPAKKEQQDEAAAEAPAEAAAADTAGES